MRICDIPGSTRVADNHPYLYGLEVREAFGLVWRELCHGWSPRQAREQQQVLVGLHAGLGRINWLPTDTIVQVGANDGKFDDPLYDILKNTGCRALLVEPTDIAFNALHDLHRGRPNIQTVQTALSRDGGEITLFIPETEGKTLNSSAWACLDIEQVIGEIKHNLGSQCVSKTIINEVTMPTLTAAQLLEQCDMLVSEVVAVVCDTEGQDVEVVRSFLDAGTQPSVIYYEQLHVPLTQTEGLKSDLRNLGYQIQESKKDVLALLA